MQVIRSCPSAVLGYSRKVEISKGSSRCGYSGYFTTSGSFGRHSPRGDIPFGGPCTPAILRSGGVNNYHTSGFQCYFASHQACIPCNQRVNSAACCAPGRTEIVQRCHHGLLRLAIKLIILFTQAFRAAFPHQLSVTIAVYACSSRRRGHPRLGRRASFLWAHDSKYPNWGSPLVIVTAIARE